MSENRLDIKDFMLCGILKCLASYREHKATNLLLQMHLSLKHFQVFKANGESALFHFPVIQIFTPICLFCNSADSQSCHVAPCHGVPTVLFFGNVMKRSWRSIMPWSSIWRSESSSAGSLHKPTKWRDVICWSHSEHCRALGFLQSSGP